MWGHRLAAILFAVGFLIGCTNTSFAILLDDFSIDQVGISTDQQAESDRLQHPDLLGENRTMYGGGASIAGVCSECEISAEISGGRFFVTPGDDCPGGVVVGWDGSSGNNLGLNLSGETGIQVEVAELIGVVEAQVSIYSGGDFRIRYFVMTLDSTGTFTFPLSKFTPPLALQSIDRIYLSPYVDIGEFIAFDSVRTVPEPSAGLLIGIALAFRVRARCRCK